VTDSQKQENTIQHLILSKLVLIIITICALGLPFTIGNWFQSGFHNVDLVHIVFMALAIAVYFRPSKQKIVIDTILVSMFLLLLILIGAYKYGLSSGLVALLIASSSVIAVMHNRKASAVYSIVMTALVAALILFLANDPGVPMLTHNSTTSFINVSVYSIVAVLISFTLIVTLLINFQNRLKQSLVDLGKQAEQIDYLANHDHLTGLNSARLAQEQLELTLKMAKRHNFKAAILYIDIDKFRLINDALGYEAGDYVLKQVAKRIKELIRDTDVACRRGGDKFLVILHYPISIEACDVICQRLICAFDKRVPYKDHEIKINLSIGIAIYPDHGDTQFDLRERASKAMYLSKDKRNDKHHSTLSDLG
jgi:diguanylate cyclase (GGDEF)-like protein